MSSVKQYNLPAFAIIPKQAASGNITSSVTNIFNKDNIGIQCVWDGTLSGTLTVQISADYNANTNSGTWTSLPNPASTGGTPGNTYFDILPTSAPFIQLVFTYSSGSGNLTATIVGKAV